MPLADPTLQELNGRVVAGGRRQPFAVAEDLEVLEAGSSHVGMGGVGNAMHPVVEGLNPLSVGASSRQLPFLLIEQVVP